VSAVVGNRATYALLGTSTGDLCSHVGRVSMVRRKVAFLGDHVELHQQLVQLDVLQAHGGAARRIPLGNRAAVDRLDDATGDQQAPPQTARRSA
jgi:hypothetical protein